MTFELRRSMIPRRSSNKAVPTRNTCNVRSPCFDIGTKRGHLPLEKACGVLELIVYTCCWGGMMEGRCSCSRTPRSGRTANIFHCSLLYLPPRPSTSTMCVVSYWRELLLLSTENSAVDDCRMSVHTYLRGFDPSMLRYYSMTPPRQQIFTCDHVSHLLRDVRSWFQC